MGLGKKLISNTSFLLIDFFVVSIFSYIFYSIIGKFQSISPADYGIIVTVINTSIILSAISLFGFGNVVQKLIPEYIQNKKRNSINKLITLSAKIIFIINLSILVILTLFSNQIAPFIKVSPMDIMLVGILTFATSLSNFSGSIILGFQEMKKYAMTDAVGYFIKAAGTFALLFFIQASIVPIVIFSIGLFVIFLTRFNFSWLKPKSEKLDYKEIISNYAFPTFIGGIAWMIFTNAQYLILTVIQNPATTGVFSVAAIIATLIATVPNTMSSALFPILSQLSVSPTFKKQREFLVAKVLRYSFLIVIPMALLFSLFPEKIIIIFSRSQFLGAVPLFPILSFAAVVSGIGMFFLSSLYALKKIKLNRNIIILTAIVFLSISIILTKMFSAIGLAVSYTVSIAILFSVSLFYLRKLIIVRISYLNIFKNILAAIIWLAIYYYISLFATNNLLQFIFIIVTFPVYFIALLPLRFYDSEDIKVFDFIKNNSPQFVKFWIEKIMLLISKFT